MPWGLKSLDIAVAVVKEAMYCGLHTGNDGGNGGGGRAGGGHGGGGRAGGGKGGCGGTDVKKQLTATQHASASVLPLHVSPLAYRDQSWPGPNRTELVHVLQPPTEQRPYQCWWISDNPLLP